MAKSEIILTDLSLEALAEMANEAGSQVEGFARKTVEAADRAGRYLLAAKSQVDHGEWSAWIGTNWLWSQRTAQQYMQIAESNARNSALLKDAKSVSSALRLITDESMQRKAIEEPQAEVPEPQPSYPTPDASPVVPVPAKQETGRGADPAPSVSRKASRSESESGKDSDCSPQVPAVEVVAVKTEPPKPPKFDLLKELDADRIHDIARAKYYLANGMEAYKNFRFLLKSLAAGDLDRCCLNGDEQ